MATSATFKNRLLNSIRDERGSVAPIFGLMAMPLMFTIALAFEQSNLNDKRARLQFALDAAALAAMSSEASTTSELDAVADKFFAANAGPLDSLSHDVTITKTDAGEINATATASVPVTVASILGYNTVQISANSMVEPPREVTTTEVVTTSGDVPCLHVMDQSDCKALRMKSISEVEAPLCTVQVRSNKSDALEIESSSKLKFKAIEVKGQADVISSSEITIVDAPNAIEENASVTGNPYENSIKDVVQNIAVGNCTTANTGKTWTGSVSPGTYCGTTTFNNATFQSGVYVIKSGSGSSKNGKLKFSGSINGSAGVTFYLADNKSTFNSYAVNQDSVLKAPSTGTTRGLLFFEDSNRGSNWNLTIESQSKQTWEGLVYLPSADLTFKSDSEWEANISMASNTLLLESISKFNITPYSWTPFNMSEPIRLDGETSESAAASMTEMYLKD